MFLASWKPARHSLDRNLSLRGRPRRAGQRRSYAARKIMQAPCGAERNIVVGGHLPPRCGWYHPCAPWCPAFLAAQETERKNGAGGGSRTLTSREAQRTCARGSPRPRLGILAERASLAGIIVQMARRREHIFGRVIRERRRRRELTQQEVARRIRTSTAYIAHLESGRRRPSEEVARRLAEVLGLEQRENLLAG